jgi:hypothetical protein
MNAGELNHLESRRRALLGQLQTADVNLRSGLHQHGMDAIVRAHLERALAHTREAYIAVNEQTTVRTVQELADQLARVEQIQADLRARQTPADESSTSIHV